MGVKTAGWLVRGNVRKGLLSTASVAALLTGAALLSAPAAAQQAGQTVEAQRAIAFDIPGQDLNAALLSFAHGAGLQLFYEADWVANRRSTPLTGSFTAQQGLTRLLAGTGMSFHFTGPNTVTLDKLPAAGGDAMRLDPVSVEGTATAPRQAEIGNLPPAYAGDQVARGSKLGMLGNRDIMDTPFNTTSYTAELIQNQQARTVADVLENDPSVRFSTSAGHVQENYRIRGFAITNNEMALNGMYGLSPSGHVPTEFLERVEVLKGPNALLNGVAPSGAVGGTINLVTKRATDAPVTTVTTDYTVDGQAGIHADIGRRFGADGQFGVRINAVTRDGESGVEGETKNSQMGAVALDYRGEDLRLSLDAYNDREAFNNGSPMTVNFATTVAAVPSAPDSDTNLFRGIFGKQNSAAVVMRGEYDITRDLTAYAALGKMDHSQYGFITSTHARNVAASGTYATTTTFRQDYTDSVSAEAGLRANVKTGELSHQLVVSATQLDQKIGTSNVTATGTAGSSNIFAPTTPRLAADSGIPLPSEDITLTSVAVADTLSVLDERIQLTLGARNQNIDYVGYTAGKRSSAYDQSAITPAVGLVIKPVPEVSVYGNYIEGLAKGDRVSATAATNYGEVFAPYRSRQMEGGVKWDAGKIANTLSVFQITRNSLTNIGNVYMEGQQRNRGVEWNVFGEATEGVRVLGGIAYTRAVYTKHAQQSLVGNEAFGTPTWQGNLSGEWDLPWVSGLTLEGRAVYTGQQYVNSTNTLSIPEWWRFDLGGRYTVPVHKTQLTLRGYVTNVMDKNYWVGAFADSYLTLSESRTFMLSATVGF